MAKVATIRLISVQDNLTFVVDMSKLDSIEDIRTDDLGSWYCMGSICVTALCLPLVV